MSKFWFSVALVGALTAPAAADTRKAAVHLKQGAAYHKAQQYDDAIAEFKKAYELDPKPQTLFNIGNAYFKKGDYQSAVDYYQKYLDAEPEGRFATQALEFSAIAKKTLADEEAKRKAAEATARDEAEKKRIADEQEAKRVAATAHVREAQAFAKAGSHERAGDAYRAAYDVNGAPELLVDAGDAYRLQPALAKARDAYRAYLDKVPLGTTSDNVRVKLAEVTAELDKQATPARSESTAGSGTTGAAVDVIPTAPRAPSKKFVQASIVVPPRGIRGPSKLMSTTGGNSTFAVESAIGFEVAGTYALSGLHGLTVSATYVKMTLLDDATQMGIDNGSALRLGLGYRLLSRRGSLLRPTIGAHVSYYSINVDDDRLSEKSESRAGFEPELGLMIQARDNFYGHVMVRIDVVPIFGEGIFLGVAGVGAGAHF